MRGELKEQTAASKKKIVINLNKIAMKRIIICGIALTILMAMLLTSCHKETNNNSSTENPIDDHYANQQYPPTAQVIRKAVTDIDGNIYDAVQIGDQVWMAENLRTTRYADGTEIPLSPEFNWSMTLPYRSAPGNNQSNEENMGNVARWGYLYNWAAVMYKHTYVYPYGIQGICPDGWHVPSVTEWDELYSYLRTQPEYISGNDSFNVAKSLAATWGWRTSVDDTTECDINTPGNDPSSNNATGFSALPAGSAGYDGFGGFGGFAIFWTTGWEKSKDMGTDIRLIHFNGAVLGGNWAPRQCNCSVRCVRNE